MNLKSTIQGRALLAFASATAATALGVLFTFVQHVPVLFGSLLLFFALLFMWPRPMAEVRKESDRERWARIRSRGWRYFLVQHALLRFALPVGLAMMLYSILLEPVVFDGRLPGMAEFSGPRLLRLLVVSAVVWPLAGWGWGTLMWRANERRFQAGPV